MGALFHPLRVRSVERDAADAVLVSFDVPAALAPVFGFTQGQYLTLRTTIDGAEQRRSYSICAGVDDGVLQVGVRRVRGGVFSGWVHDRLRPGDTVEAMAPQGRFHVPLAPGLRRHHLAIAGGSGITPILSILKTVLAREPLSRFTLIYGNRTGQSTMFKEALADLKNRHMSRLSLHLLFSAEPTESPLHSGRMTAQKLGECLATVVQAATIDHAYVCGPFDVNDQAEAALRAAGVPAERIHVERFGVASAPGRAVDAVVHAARPGDAARARVVVIRDALRREFDFHRDQASLLEAATAAGLEVPFSCTSGVCGTCRAKVREGAVRMARNFALEAADVAAGYVLTCQAHPLTERVVLSFDEP